MKTKPQAHTPGPWDYNGEAVFARLEPQGDHYPGDKGPLAHVAVVHPRDNWESDARLIAAAPDLLEAARAYLEVIHGDESPEANTLRAAIAKATGPGGR